MRRIRRPFIVLLVLLGACSSGVDASGIPELPETDPDDVAVLLATSDQPVVLNVWASWCIPCRSEAPLLDQASAAFENEVRFVGINVRDSQSGARGFIAEFFPDAPIEHLFDRSGVVPPSLGAGTGVPLTLFYDAGGELSNLHYGIIDERTLALQIDELLLRAGA